MKTMQVPENVLIAWLCFYYVQVSDDDYDSSTHITTIPAVILEGWVEKGWVKTPEGFDVMDENGSWNITLTDLGIFKAQLNAADWFCLPRRVDTEDEV